MVLGLSKEGNRNGRIEHSVKEFVSKRRREMSSWRWVRGFKGGPQDRINLSECV